MFLSLGDVRMGVYVGGFHGKLPMKGSLTGVPYSTILFIFPKLYPVGTRGCLPTQSSRERCSHSGPQSTTPAKGPVASWAIAPECARRTVTGAGHRPTAQVSGDPARRL